MAEQKWTLTAIIGAIVLLSAGGIVFYNSDYKYLLSSMPDREIFILKYDAGDKVEIVTRSSVCDYALFRITKDEMTAKCGYRVIVDAKWYLEYFKTYGEDEWVRLQRKNKGITLDVSETENGYIVRRVTPYYATASKTGDAGKLTETFHVTKERVKSSLEFETPYKSRTWRVVWNTNPNTEVLEDGADYMKLAKELNIVYSDTLFDYRKGDDAYYKVQKGPFKIDPLIRFGNESSTLTEGSFLYGSCIECDHGGNVSFSSSSSAFSATYESGWMVLGNISAPENMTQACADSVGGGYCEMSFRNGTDIIPTNDSDTITRCLFDGSVACHDRRLAVGVGNSSSPGAINNFEGLLINESDTAYLGINSTENSSSLAINYTLNLTIGSLEMMVTFK